jgi:hypothetical protein
LQDESEPVLALLLADCIITYSFSGKSSFWFVKQEFLVCEAVVSGFLNLQLNRAPTLTA